MIIVIHMKRIQGKQHTPSQQVFLKSDHTILIQQWSDRNWQIDLIIKSLESTISRKSFEKLS